MCGALVGGAAGQIASASRPSARPLHANVVIPQTRVFCGWRPGPVRIQAVRADVKIVEQVATTALEVDLHNPSGARLEAELLVPVPDGSVVQGFTFRGAASEPSAEVLRREKATSIYEALVEKARDPALLEFVGFNLIRSSLFPVEANGTQTVRLVYENLLPAEGDRVDYVLPRSESLEYAVPWSVTVEIRTAAPISTVYSPSHRVTMTRKAANALTVRTTAEAAAAPGPFRLSYLKEHGGMAATLLAYPDASSGGGYFLLLAGLPAEPREGNDVPGLKREVTLVLDRSGSMNGEKIEQVREAAFQILAGLEPGEAFNILVYNETVDVFAPEPVEKTPETEKAAREFLGSFQARGGTNLHDALLEALRQPPSRRGDGILPLVLFLTDGLPTVGQTSEAAIRKIAAEANPYRRRIFTVGVGFDVNTPLLEAIAFESRAATTFVLPGENVEAKVAQVFRRLSGPVLADVAVRGFEPLLSGVTGGGGEPGGSRVRDVLPRRIPDLFDGDQLVLLGRYDASRILRFEVSGNFLGRERTFRFDFAMDRATARNAYVPRLWASRKIADLVDAIRELGADGDPLAQASVPTADDPRVQELVDEIVRLSTEFGILTEYTAFLAREGTDLAQIDEVNGTAARNFAERAIGVRSGKASVNQEFNNGLQKVQTCLNGRNEFLNDNLEVVAITSVQQVSDRAFWRRGGRWIDSRLAGLDDEGGEPARVIEYGSEAFRRLAARMAEEGRQGCIALSGDILLLVDGERVLVRGPKEAGPSQGE